jgi:hypothetical protein
MQTVDTPTADRRQRLPPAQTATVMRGIGLYALALVSFTVLDASA